MHYYLRTYMYMYISLRSYFPLYNYVSAAGLGEFRIRDLNDEINKLLREKRHWEERIVELGGADYTVRGRGEKGGRGGRNLK